MWTTASWHLSFPKSFKLWQSLIHSEWCVLVKALAEHHLCIMLVVCYNHLMAPFDLVRTSLAGAQCSGAVAFVME